MEPNDSLTISELYLSVQGEAAFAGHPCVMLRLTGCPLRCKWCDTVYSFKGGQVIDFETLEQKIEVFGIKTIEVTGGEPLAQKNIIPFMERLVKKSYTVMIETSGSEDISAVSKGVHIIMDIKCPDSKMESKNLYSNLEYLKDTDELKFVIASRGDFDWAVRFLHERSMFEKKHPLLFSPAWGLVDPKDLVAWILETKLPIKLNLQWHKYIWGPRTKGV